MGFFIGRPYTSLRLGKAVKTTYTFSHVPTVGNTVTGGGEGREARWAAAAGRGTRKEGRGWGEGREDGLGE